MIYGSVCSGIEAATQAWHPLGWTPAFFSEIEKFPSAVLAHHYGSNMPGEDLSGNGVPNHGDMTKFQEWPHHAIDLLVGGTPCQTFSIAGLRAGLDDARGNLMLVYGAIAQRYRPRWLAWENVPGVLSSNSGLDFASLLGLLSGRRIEVPVGGWSNAGIVPGYGGAYGLAWRVLDAQFIRVDGFARAVPQRRRRVFVVGYLGDWRRSAAVLLEPESMRGHPPPRREAGKGTASDVAPSLVSSGRGVERTGETRGQDPVVAEYIDDAARCVTAGYAQRLDWETENFVAHSLRGEGFDASEDGTGRGTPIVPVTAKTLTRGAESAGKGGYAGRRQEDDDNLVAYPLTSGMAASASRMPHEQGALLPIAFAQNSRDEVRLFGGDGQTVGALSAEPGMKQTSYVAEPAYGIGSDAVDRSGEGDGSAGQRAGLNIVEGVQPALRARPNNSVAHGWAVRRLTPRECERLQGFRDDFTLVPFRGKPAADGPRYKALGNSMAVNVMEWLGRRIQMVDDLGGAA